MINLIVSNIEILSWQFELLMSITRFIVRFNGTNTSFTLGFRCEKYNNIRSFKFCYWALMPRVVWLSANLISTTRRLSFYRSAFVTGVSGDGDKDEFRENVVNLSSYSLSCCLIPGLIY